MEGGYSLQKLLQMSTANASNGDFTGANEQEVPKFIAMMTHYIQAVLQSTTQSQLKQL